MSYCYTKLSLASKIMVNNKNTEGRANVVSDGITEKLTDELTEELLIILARQVKRVPFPILIAFSVIATNAAKVVPVWLWLSWLLLALAILVVRWVVLSALPKAANMPLTKRVNISIFLSFINGLCHSISVIFIQDLSGVDKSIQTLLLLTLCTGSIVTTAGYRRLFLAYSLPVLISLALAWSFFASDNVDVKSRFTVLALIILFGAIIMTIAKDTFALFAESFNIRLQHVKLNQELQVALAAAENANQSKTRFLASASHDLRQPIHTLSLFGAALEVQNLDDKTREISKFINSALAALASQLDALLDISKLDANVVAVNLSQINITTMLQRLYIEMKPLTNEKSIEFLYDQQNSQFVYTDESLLERILRNLISNAIRYTNKGHIYISQFEKMAAPHTLIIRIEDTGIGIADSDKKSIFDEFYQAANPERDRAKGLGLGLAIVKRLVNLLKVKLHFTSTMGIGTVFELELPLVQRNLQSSLPSKAVVAAMQKIKILVIDDEADVAMGMKILFENHSHCVALAENKDSAIQSAKTTKPDIVISDLRLRDKENGIDVINAIRVLYPGIPAILLTGDTAPERLVEAKQSGYTLLFKPVNPTHLLETVSTVIAEG